MLTSTEDRSRRRLLRLGAALIPTPWWAGCAGTAHRDSPLDQPRAAVAAPARWALVLSGGGLHGFAHLGVLRALRRLDLEPPLVVGSSVGAVVGALYAAGARLDAWERLALAPELDPWGSLLRSPLARSSALRALLEDTLQHRCIEDFERRFAAVATDRASGEAHAFGGGDAVTAVLASAALPGAMAPELIGGQQYVDGGLSQPLPVRMARALGAQRVVAVDVSFHPHTPARDGRIESVFHGGLLMVRNLSAPDREAADVLIEPVLPPVPEVTLGNRAALADCGERATLALALQLRAAAGVSTQLQGVLR